MKFFLAATIASILICSKSTSAEEMKFSLAGNSGNCNGCEWIAAEGEIVSETPLKFQNFIAENGAHNRTVVLNSGGGNLIAALEFGTTIRELGLWTSVGKTVTHSDLGPPHEDRVDGKCASACVYAFAGGVERFSSGGNLGVHQFYGINNSAPTAETQAIVGLLLIYLMQMGVDLEVLAQSLFTRPNEIHWFSETDIREYSLTTEDNEYSEPWKLEPYKDGLVVTATHHANTTETAQMTFFCRKSDGRWRLLISELISEKKHQPDWAELRSRFARDSNIWFSEQQLNVDQNHLEFMKAD